MSVAAATRRRGSTATWGAAIQVLEAERIVVTYSLVPLDPSPDRLPLLLEFAARATWGLATSTFEVDASSGSSRLRTGIDVEHLLAVGASDAQLRAVVQDLVYTNVAVTDIVLPLAIGVIVGELTPSEAAARIGE